MGIHPWWIWIVVFGFVVICYLVGMIRRGIARSRSGLDSEEMAVVRSAARVGSGEAIGRTLGYGALIGLQLPPPPDLRALRYYKDRAAAKELVPINPTEQNRAEGVIFSFHELRLTRTELIRGYDENAQLIPLQGLTATAITGQTVSIRIEGPDTKFVYRNAFDAEFNQTRAHQFAALLNYEASLLDADGHQKSTKVRCLHCQHVQTVPVSQKTFMCEQCKARLKRGTASAHG